MEERCILRNYSDGTTKGFYLDLTNVLSIDNDSSVRRLVKAEEKSEDGGFSTPAWSDNSYFFTGGNGEGYVSEDGSIWMVTEGDVFEADFSSGE